MQAESLLRETQSQLETTRTDYQGEASRRMEMENQWTLDKRTFECERSELSVKVSKLEDEAMNYQRDLQRKQEVE